MRKDGWEHEQRACRVRGCPEVLWRRADRERLEPVAQRRTNQRERLVHRKVKQRVEVEACQRRRCSSVCITQVLPSGSDASLSPRSRPGPPAPPPSCLRDLHLKARRQARAQPLQLHGMFWDEAMAADAARPRAQYPPGASTRRQTCFLKS